MRAVVALVLLLTGCVASSKEPETTEIVAILNGGLNLRADFVQKFAGDRAFVSDTMEALAIIGDGGWEVVDDRSTPIFARVTIQAQSSRRYDIAYRFNDNEGGTFMVSPRSTNDTAVDDVKIGYSIAHLSESGCGQLAEKNSRERLPISSVSKLAVIGATLDAVEAGRFKLDYQLELQASDRSLPSGTWHTLPIGSKRAVADALSAALLSSDNTANDLLIRTVGRTNVHDFAVEHLDHDPELPFLTTVELFKLSWSADPGLRKRFISGGFHERMEILVNEVPHLAMPVLSYNEEPVDNLQIQWFGRPEALCKAWARLLADTRWTELVASFPPTLEFGLQGWHSIGHKAGYAPGNRSFSGVAELDCGAIVSYTGAVVFEDNSLDVESEFILANILTGESLIMEKALCG